MRNYIPILVLAALCLIEAAYIPDMYESVKRLKDCGFHPEAVLDVGANIGEWAQDVQSLFPNTSIFMIEGNEKHREVLKSRNMDFEIALVGENERNITYYVSKVDARGTGNSVFRENTAHFPDKNTELVSARIQRIDDILENRGINKKFQFLKYDIQGSEYNALLGSIKTMKDAEVIHTEVAIMNYNQGASSFMSLHSLMELSGFAIYDTFGLARGGNGYVAIGYDLVWVKKTSPLWRRKCTGFPIPSHFKIHGGRDEMNYN